MCVCVCVYLCVCVCVCVCVLNVPEVDIIVKNKFIPSYIFALFTYCCKALLTYCFPKWPVQKAFMWLKFHEKMLRKCLQDKHKVVYCSLKRWNIVNKITWHSSKIITIIPICNNYKTEQGHKRPETHFWSHLSNILQHFIALYFFALQDKDSNVERMVINFCKRDLTCSCEWNIFFFLKIYAQHLMLFGAWLVTWTWQGNFIIRKPTKLDYQIM